MLMTYGFHSYAHFFERVQEISRYVLEHGRPQMHSAGAGALLIVLFLQADGDVQILQALPPFSWRGLGRG